MTGVRAGALYPSGQQRRKGDQSPVIFFYYREHLVLTENRLTNAIGAGERVSLSKLAVSHLERTARPIRIAVDISIWLFQVQAGRGGKNPELRTFFFRLLKLLALPIHPLFVYDGRHKPPFKRGKAVSARSYGNSPLIQRSKDLIERFRFSWHEAPGEAEAECARLQASGIVDAVMSDDVDALMFGSTLTIMNYSKESGSGTTSATHVTCYSMGNEGHVSNIPFDRAGMILFAMLSGGDYLPSGVPKCGSKLAAEIAKAGFGEDLLQELTHSSDPDSGLDEWRERLQYELEENESGYFETKHKAVRIPNTFPDRTIFEYYARPKVSTEDEMASLRQHLRHAWDRDIDPLAIRSFTAEHFEWNYRSGARKLIRLLAEPLISYRLRLQRPVSDTSRATLAPDCNTPWLQKVYRSRANFGTDGTTELQMDMLPIDVVGIDLLAQEPNPLPPTQESAPSQNAGGEEDDDPEVAAETAPPTPSKTRVTKGFDPFSIEKVWVFETVARLGVPDIVKKWEDEQAAKANKAAAKAAGPKKSSNKRKKKGPIDPDMKRGSILKYGTLTKEKSELSSSNKSDLFETATSTSFKNPPSFVDQFDLEDPFTPSMYSHEQSSSKTRHVSHEVDELIGNFAALSTVPSTARMKRHPMASQSRIPARAGLLVGAEAGIEELSLPTLDIGSSSQPAPRQNLRISCSFSDRGGSATNPGAVSRELAISTSLPKIHRCNNSKKTGKTRHVAEKSNEVNELERAIGCLSLEKELGTGCHEIFSTRSLQQPASLKQPKSSSHLSDCQPSEDPSSSKADSSKDDAACAAEPVIPLQRQSDNTTATLGSDPDHWTGSHDKKRPLRKPKRENSESRQTVGHAHNVTTEGGFWAVGTPAAPETASTEANDSEQATTSAGRRNRQTKRVPRVSILDMI